MDGILSAFMSAAMWYFFGRSPDGEVVVMIDTWHDADPTEWIVQFSDHLTFNCQRRQVRLDTLRYVRSNRLNAQEQAICESYWRTQERECREWAQRQVRDEES